jgi:acylphosphatase
MPRINHDPAVSSIQIRLAFLVPFHIHPKRLKRITKVWKTVKKTSRNRMTNFTKFDTKCQVIIKSARIIVKHLNIQVRGRVQGVGFRYSALRAARSYGICGFVRNEADGSVYIEAEAEQIKLDLFLDWCRRSPGHSRVDNVQQTESNIQGFGDFRVLH